MTTAAKVSRKLIYANPLWLDDEPMTDIDDDYCADGDRLFHCQ